MKKEFRGPGKGMNPKVGYNAKKWYANYDGINWHKTTQTTKKKWCPACGKWGNHTSGSCPTLKK